MPRSDRMPVATALLPRLKQAIDAVPPSTLLDCLGYRSGGRRRAMERIERLKHAPDLFAWLRQPGYDFRYTQQELFLALAECREGIERAEAEAVLEEVRREQARLDSMYRAWIHVDIGPARPTHPLFIMAFTGTARFIRLDPEEIQEDFCAELNRVRDIVRAHYRRHEGVIPCWGKIRKYDWHFGKGQVLCLSPEEEVLTQEAPDSQQARAVVALR